MGERAYEMTEETNKELEHEATSLLTKQFGNAVDEIIKKYRQKEVNINLVIFAAIANTINRVSEFASAVSGELREAIVADTLRIIDEMCYSLRNNHKK